MNRGEILIFVAMAVDPANLQSFFFRLTETDDFITFCTILWNEKFKTFLRMNKLYNDGRSEISGILKENVLFLHVKKNKLSV